MQKVAQTRTKKYINNSDISLHDTPSVCCVAIPNDPTHNNKMHDLQESRTKKCIKKMYSCEPCNYHSINKCNYAMHILTKKHLLNETLDDNICLEKYACIICNYETYRLNDYNKHLLTKKHSICQMEMENQSSVKEESDKIVVDKTIFIEIMKNNTEFKELITEQNKTIMEQNTKINKILENGVGNTINTHFNNSKTFNLHLFLNEQCKDAINIIDFINSLHFNAGSVEYTGKHGYVEGMTKLIMDGLKELDIYKRPIHCTDLKRDVLYIKDENKWEKDNDEKIIFNKALNEVVRKNMQQIRKWREENPRCEVMETKEYEFHFILMQQCIGGGTGHQEMNNKKILKNIAKYVLVDKSIVNEPNES